MKIEANELLRNYRMMFEGRTKVFEKEYIRYMNVRHDRKVYMIGLVSTYSQLRGMLDLLIMTPFTDLELIKKYEDELLEWYCSKKKEVE